MKTLYNLIAIVAIANLLILGGLAGYLIASGRLNGQSAAMVAKVLRGETLVPASPTTTSAPATTASAPAPAAGSGSPSAVELQMAMLDREKRALDVDRYSRLTDAQLKLIRDREALAQAQEDFNRLVKVRQQTTEDEGFSKMLATYSKLPPKVVKEDFLKLDPDVVVRYLINMPTRTQAKILQEFKTPDEQKRRLEITERIRTQQELANPTTQKAGG